MRLCGSALGIGLLSMVSLGADLRLIDAARSGDAKTIRALLAQKAGVNAADADGSTALHYAARNDRLDIADLLIAAGANVNAATRYHITPLSLACINGDAVLIEHLLKAGADANGTSEEGQTALMSAALAGKLDAIKVLLAHGAEVNAREPVRGQSALMWAASKGNTAAVETLIEAGAEVKAKSKAGFTPLLFAVRNGHKETVETLLAHGADANDTAGDGTSVMNVAVVNACFEIAAVLLEHGANPNAPDARGSALHTIAWLRKPGSDGGDGLGKRSYGTPLQVGNMTALELAKLLLEHGANPNLQVKFKERLNLQSKDATAVNPPLIHLGRHILTYSGATPFYLAARNGDAPYMRLLAEHGADPKKNNDLHISPLIVAAGLDYWEGESAGPYTGVSEAERLEAVKLAIALGNDINYAAVFGDFKMEGSPEYLLLYYPLNMKELGKIVPSDPRWSGCTALHAAVVSNQPSIVQYLVDHGAKLDAKTQSGWTPLMMAGGTFFANAKRDFPAAAAILKKAMAEQGLIARQD
ncbi:MAG TPA: ankyrin repeat domain-containing protein [Bryobacteraceae bacterium]|nr:ankyrin repeat domain-containing protein [Bryobacteraceae bacterium]